MGLRFRRTIKLLPGVRLNLSKSGVSTSLGVRGAHVTLGHGRARETVGLPGTGISYTETHSTRAREAHEQLEQPAAASTPRALATVGNLIYLAAVLAPVLVLGYCAGMLIR
jgi:hypothetical protein